MEQIERLAAALEENSIPFLRDEPMSRHTTFLVGGPASLFIRPGSAAQLTAVQELCSVCGVRLFVLGRGSNLLVSDNGLPFAVLSMSGYEGIERTGERTVCAKSGTNLSALCRYTADNGLAGLAFGYGIPGTVGGAVYMNAGAYGGEIKDVVTSVTFLDEQGVERTLPREQLDFAYRHSIFCGKNCIILSAELTLTQGEPETIRAEMDTCMKKRREKQPLEYGSAGSTFKRPQGAYAAALIDECGLKGYTVGGAQVSAKHAGFVVNIGGATATDVVAVMEQVRRVVKEKTGFELEAEVQRLP